MTTRSAAPARDPLLFTPGPLTTSQTVKQAMLRDAGSWHWEFNAMVASVRDRVLGVAGVSRANGWECVLVQGSGTYGVEAVFASVVPPEGKVCILSNGAYGERMVQMCRALRIPHTVLRTTEDTPPAPAEVERALANDPALTHLACVHCETTTGIVNPIAEAGQAARRQNRVYIVDAMSSFGGIPIDLEQASIDYLISSPNKCLESVPGFSFVIARRAGLLACNGYARCLSLDLLGQLQGFERNGQFRFTPPTHTILAFERALDEFDAEGGVAARAARYRRNHEVLMNGMRGLGFRSYLRPEHQSYIITSFHFPADAAFAFEVLYRELSEAGHIIYPGKISQADTFRIGSIGRIFESDVRGLLDALGRVVAKAGWRMAST
jgi:2-aminoethylphosphonate-pyruvate transaminase